METTQVLTDKQADKKVVVCNGVLLSHKPNEILPFVTTWVDREGLSAKWNKSDGERQIQYDFTYMWNLKKKMNKKPETDS